MKKEDKLLSKPPIIHFDNESKLTKVDLWYDLVGRFVVEKLIEERKKEIESITRKLNQGS